MLKKDKIKNIPQNPGIYLLKDKNNNVLYVGKAKNLNKRIKQYFLSQSLKIKKLIEEAENVEFLETKNEVEAIFKESDLIKKLNPPYNQLLRDDSQYFYIIFTNEKFPRVLITHRPEKFKTKEIIGPFSEGTALRTILKILRKEIPFCTCLNLHQRACLNASLGLCFGFCCQKGILVKEKDIKIYEQNLEFIKEILKGKLETLKKKFLNKIKKLLKEEKIKDAERLKNIYLAIKKIEQEQDLIKEDTFLKEHNLRKILIKLKNIFNLKSLAHRLESIDISHLAGKEKVGIILTFIDGIYQPNFLRKFKIKSVLKPDDPRMIFEIIKRRLKHKEWGFPDLFLIDGGKIQLKFALKAIEESNLNIKAIALAKPKNEIYFDLKKKPLILKDKDLRDFILSINRKTHKFVLKYHQRKREKII